MYIFKGTKIIVDSGVPLGRLATGTAIADLQSAAIYLPYTCHCKLDSIQFYISNPYQDNLVKLSLCKELDQDCITGQIMAPKAKRIKVDWQPNLELKNQSYWFVVKGIAPIESSFTWLDVRDFNASTAFWNGSKWILEPMHRYGLSIIVSVFI
jgi:hypothetical protein